MTIEEQVILKYVTELYVYKNEILDVRISDIEYRGTEFVIRFLYKLDDWGMDYKWSMPYDEFLNNVNRIKRKEKLKCLLKKK